VAEADEKRRKPEARNSNSICAAHIKAMDGVVIQAGGSEEVLALRYAIITTHATYNRRAARKEDPEPRLRKLNTSSKT